MPVTLAAIEDAPRRIAGTAMHTPLVRLNGFDIAAEIYLKLESLQPIGSFKIRGAASRTQPRYRRGRRRLPCGVCAVGTGGCGKDRLRRIGWESRCDEIVCDPARRFGLKLMHSLRDR